ncbi:MAG: cyclase family protein [Desulfobacter sp.]|nr:cyclase family protein [Desulfobacter sp.]
MTVVTDPYSGFQLVELSHEWGLGVPSYPGTVDVRMQRAVKHAQHGVLAWRINTSMHTGTHMNSPIHMIQKGADMLGVELGELITDTIMGMREVAVEIGLKGDA